ncbi:hypothetical protein ACTA71_011400 [Dictyostelium dimigraforme]
MVLCPSCQKPVYFAERQLYLGKENASRPKTFAIHEQIFCNVEENSKFKYPLAPVDGYYAGIQASPITPTNNTSVQPTKSRNNCCKNCSTEAKPTNKFCTNCGHKLDN